LKSSDLESRNRVDLLVEELDGLLDIVRDRYSKAIEDCMKRFPLTLSSILLGKAASSVDDLVVILDYAIKLLSHPEPSIRSLAILSLYELKSLLYFTTSRSSIKPVDDSEARSYAFKLISGAAPGLLIILGDDPLALERVLSKAQRLGFIVLVVSNRFREVIDGGLVIDGRRGLIRYVADNPIDGLVYSLGLAARLLSISTGSLDRDSLSKYLERRMHVGVAILSTSKSFDAILDAISDLGLHTVVLADITCDKGRVVYVDRIDDIIPTICGKLGITILLEELPIGFSSIYEGKSVRDRDVYVEFGSVKPYFELVLSRKLEEVVDGRVEVIGPDIDSMPEGSIQPLGILVEVAGARMKREYEPIIERSIHRIVNYGEETWHVGQRDSGWIRITKKGFDKGFRLKHLGCMLYIGLKRLYGDIIDKIQVKIYTDESRVNEFLKIARSIYGERDRRLIGLSDEDVERYYICSICQSFLSNHVCVVTPERPGLCGTVTYMDAEIAYELKGEASGIRPVERGKPIDPSKGEWDGLDRAVSQITHGAVNRISLYSLVSYPTTSTLSFECISVFIPECNGIMVADYSYRGETPIGLPFASIAGMISGLQMSGFLGHSRRWILSRKYFKADGGLKRIVWMPRSLKEALDREFKARCIEEGIPDLPEKIADEYTAKTLDELLEWLVKVRHPVLELPPILTF
jgi:CO dehydrogenase/CO-methylating acetyl-CoA synthase complex beta subunit